MVIIHDKVCVKMGNTLKPIPKDNDEFIKDLEELCEKANYKVDKIGLMQAKSGDLHANAVTNQNSIKLTFKLLENHQEYPEEILAIVAHELGHSYHKHMPKMALFNMFYMLVFALVMTPIIDNEQFIAAFSIKMESYFMTFLLYAQLYYFTLDIPIRFLISWMERRAEY